MITELGRHYSDYIAGMHVRASFLAFTVDLSFFVVKIFSLFLKKQKFITSNIFTLNYKIHEIKFIMCHLVAV